MPSVESILALATALLSFVGTLYFGLVRQARVEARVELLWSFMMRKGLSEALISGLVERQSPLRVSIDALEKHRDLIERVRKWYAEYGQRLPDLELSVAMETIFHPDFEHICLDEHILPAACVAAMMFLLRPQAKVFEPYRNTEWARAHA